jgi:hypothetical protein
MTAEELHALLDACDIDYEIVEIFEGVRIIRVVVDDEGESNDD